MGRAFKNFILVTAILSLTACGASAKSGSGGGATQQNALTLIGIAPSSAVVGSASFTLVAYGSNFLGNPTLEWNGSPIWTNCVDINLNTVNCSNAAALTATIPAKSLAETGTAKVTLAGVNTQGKYEISNVVNFMIDQPAGGGTWVRTVTGISAPNDIAWDSAHGKLYVSVASTDPAKANKLAVIDPVAGKATSFVSAGKNPNLLSISSDNGYLWAGIDGSNSVQRFLLPGLSKDISFPLPLDWAKKPQQAVMLQAAPESANTLALIAGHWGWSPAGDGVYIYDDAKMRKNHVPGWGAESGPMIDWMQWGKDDTRIYGNQYTTIDSGGIATLNVNSAGVSLASYGGGLMLQPTITEYDKMNGLLYSYGGAYSPQKLSLMGIFNLPVTGAEACTADSGLGRYYCVTTYSIGGTDVNAFELWVFDLYTFALVDRIHFGSSAGSTQSTISGAPWRLVRWGNAGLALTTVTETYYGNGGVFLIDGAAVNPNAAPDSTSGTSNGSYAWLKSMTPDAATTASGEVKVIITGYGFSPDSTACWNCNSLQLRLLPTTYFSPTLLEVTIPLSGVSTTEPLEVSVFDQAASMFSTNALTFTVIPASGPTHITPMNLCGLAMTWDENTQHLFVATADYDGEYPNSVVAVNPTNGTIVKSRFVQSDPSFLSDSANGEYLYVAYNSSTNLTQLALPDMIPTVTAPLKSTTGGTWLPGDMKAAPQDPHTVAATLIMPGWSPESLGGIVIFDDGKPRPDSLPGWGGGQKEAALYDTLAWSASDQLLTAAPASWDSGDSGIGFPLYQLPVNSSGVSYQGFNNSLFNSNSGNIKSDFGVNLIYSDDGSVANPATGASVGNFWASGLVTPDSSLNRVFILGQTAAQGGSNNYTIQSFNQKTYTKVSSITLNNLSGTPIALTRWGSSGLAVLTSGGLYGNFVNSFGMLYLLQNTSFVSNLMPTTNLQEAVTERVQQRWHRMTTREILEKVHQAQLEKISITQ